MKSIFFNFKSNSSAMSFIKQLWPELSIWNFYMGIMFYQLNYNYIQVKLIFLENIRAKLKLKTHFSLF
jgi:hypothetical protein